VVFTYHALQRMKERGLSKAKVRKCVRKGKYISPNGNTRSYQLKHGHSTKSGVTIRHYIRVITSADGKTIITVMKDTSHNIHEQV